MILLRVLCLPTTLPPAGFRELSSYAAVEAGVRRLLLFFEGERGHLESVEDVTKIQLCNAAYRFGPCACDGIFRFVAQRPMGTGVTSPVPN